MSDALLAEATSLSAAPFGPDPVAEAAAGIADITMLEPTPPGEPETEVDPGASQPYAVTAGNLHAYLAADLPHVAARLGQEGAAQAAETMSQLPRDVLHVMDGF